MPAHLQRRLISRDEYRRMAEAGILAEDERVELLAGELIYMSPIGSKHAACLMKCLSLLGRLLPEQVIVSPQNPILLGDFSEPEPDLALLRHRDDFYAEQLPGPEDVLLLIEIADTSVIKDREIKLPLYAEAGIPELWILNLPGQLLEIYRQPEGKSYREQHILRPGDEIQPLALPSLQIEVGQMLPG
jgi:Uma2 family endonuclease